MMNEMKWTKLYSPPSTIRDCELMVTDRYYRSHIVASRISLPLVSQTIALTVTIEISNPYKSAAEDIQTDCYMNDASLPPLSPSVFIF